MLLKSFVVAGLTAVAAAKSAVIDLIPSNFDDVVLKSGKPTLVEFFAPWCGHCKNLKPVYEEVAKDFRLEPNCIVANVDADAKLNKDLASRYGVTSYPTIKFFPKGASEPIDYEGPCSEAAFVEYLNEKCGTQRSIGGLLNDAAGRVQALDELATQFFIGDAESRATIYKTATNLAAEVGDAAKHYVRAMEKVLNGTEDYVAKESKRCVPPGLMIGVLTNVTFSGSLASSRSARSRLRSSTRLRRRQTSSLSSPRRRSRRLLRRPRRPCRMRSSKC